MKFSNTMEEIKNKEENKEKIVLVRCGAFVIAIGNDAILLSKTYGLKLTCFKAQVCKVGIPVTHALKYLELNQKTQIFKSTQGVNYCGYKINEYRLKIRDKGKRKLKNKVKKLKYEIKTGNMSSEEAQRYLAGHMGYIKIANVKNLTDKIFYKE